MDQLSRGKSLLTTCSRSQLARVTRLQLNLRSQQLGSFIREHLKLKAQEYVGIYAQNRLEWSISEHACNAFSYVLVPIYGAATCSLFSSAFVDLQTRSGSKRCNSSSISPSRGSWCALPTKASGAVPRFDDTITRLCVTRYSCAAGGEQSQR